MGASGHAHVNGTLILICYGVPANAFVVTVENTYCRMIVNFIILDVIDLMIKSECGRDMSIVIAIVKDGGNAVGLAAPIVGDRIEIAKSNVDGAVIAIVLEGVSGKALKTMVVHGGHIDNPANALDDVTE